VIKTTKQIIIVLGTAAQTIKRREQVSLCLSKSMISPTQIAQQIGAPVSKVKNDLHWMRTNAKTWLSGHTLDGYVFETKKTIDQLQDIELELQSMRSKTTDPDEKLKIMKQLIDVINTRWVIQGDGPTLMNMKYAETHGR